MQPSERVLIGVPFFFMTGCALFQSGGAGSGPGSPEPMTLRVCLAATEPKEGYQRINDEAGQPFYVDPAPLLTERDVERASIWKSRQRTMVLVEFSALSAYELQRATAVHTGGRLAVFLDDHLVMSPRVYRPIPRGKVYLDGDFSQARAEEIVRGLSAKPERGGSKP